MDPLRRDDLAVFPTPVMQIEQRKPGKVARTHANGVSRIDRGRAAEIDAVRRAIVLHANRLGRASSFMLGEDMLIPLAPSA